MQLSNDAINGPMQFFCGVAYRGVDIVGVAHDRSRLAMLQSRLHHAAHRSWAFLAAVFIADMHFHARDFIAVTRKRLFDDRLDPLGG